MTENVSRGADDAKPPWMAFQTFWTFVQDLSGQALPPVIDRSLMASKSGTDQANLFAALKYFGLIDSEHRVLPRLANVAVDDPDSRKLALNELIRQGYGGPLQVSAGNGTHAQLQERFRADFGITGADSLRKTTTFFLQACREAEIQVSPHFKQTRASGSAGASRTRKVRKPTKSAELPAGSQSDDSGAVAHQVSVELRAGGTMTLSVSVNPLSLRGGDRVFFYDIVDKLMDYQESTVGNPDSQTQQESE